MDIDISSPPRRVPRGQKIQWMRERALAFYAGLVFSGISFFYIFTALAVFSFFKLSLGSNVPDYDRLMQEGTETTGELTQKETNYSTTINDVHPIVLHYTYTKGASPKKFDDTMETLNIDAVRDWQKGRKVEVKYDETDSIITEVGTYNFNEIFSPIFLFTFLVGVSPYILLAFLLLLYCKIRANKLAKLYSLGEIQPAKIEGIQQYGGFNHRIHVTYSFEPEKDKIIRGESFSKNLAIIGNKSVGEEVDILVLKDDPSINCVTDEYILRRCTTNSDKM